MREAMVIKRWSSGGKENKNNISTGDNIRFHFVAIKNYSGHDSELQEHNYMSHEPVVCVEDSKPPSNLSDVLADAVVGVCQRGEKSMWRLIGAENIIIFLEILDDDSDFERIAAVQCQLRCYAHWKDASDQLAPAVDEHHFASVILFEHWIGRDLQKMVPFYGQNFSPEGVHRDNLIVMGFSLQALRNFELLFRCQDDGKWDDCMLKGIFLRVEYDRSEEAPLIWPDYATTDARHAVPDDGSTTAVQLHNTYWITSTAWEFPHNSCLTSIDSTVM